MSEIRIKHRHEDGRIFQVEMEFEEIGTATVDIAYSGDEDEEGNDILEFCWALAEPESNPDLNEAAIDDVNEDLECGDEERIVRFLIEEYRETGIRFHPGEHDWAIENT